MEIQKPCRLTRDQLNEAIEEYLARGGTISRIDTRQKDPLPSSISDDRRFEPSPDILFEDNKVDFEPMFGSFIE